MDATSGRKKRKGLPQKEITDLHSSLEHIIAVGSKVRRDQERQYEFQQRHAVLLQREHELPLDAPPVNPLGPPVHPDFDLHAEDVRIYGAAYRTELGFAKRPWPKKKIVKDRFNPALNDDTQWDIEHGDTIHPLAFTTAKLSQKEPPTTEEERNMMNGKNLHVSSTDISLSTSQVPRALLLRCWERAVHAASNTMHVPVSSKKKQHTISSQEIRGANNDPEAPTNDTTAAESQLATNSSNPFEGTILGLSAGAAEVGPILPLEKPKSIYECEQEATSQNFKSTANKCRSLDICIPKQKSRSGNSCPICFRDFKEDVTLLKRHYYGGPGPNDNTNEKEKGCCWKQIPSRQLPLIEQVLEAHVKKQADLLVGLVLEKAKEKVKETPPSGKRQRLMNWHDVLQFLNKTTEASQPLTPVQQSTHSILETLQTKPNTAPLVWNPVLLDTVQRRLIDRYADVPP